MPSTFYSTYKAYIVLIFTITLLGFSSTTDYKEHTGVRYQVTLPTRNIYLKKNYHNFLPLKFKGLLSLFIGTIKNY